MYEKVKKAMAAGLEGVDRDVLARDFGRLLIDVDEVAKRDPSVEQEVADVLREFEVLVDARMKGKDTASRTKVILDVAFGTPDGRRAAHKLVRLAWAGEKDKGGSDMRKSNNSASVAATIRTELITCEQVRKSAHDGSASLKAVTLGQLKDDKRLGILNDPLADPALVGGAVTKSAKGRALYALSRLPYSGLPFEEAVAAIEEQWPGHIVDDILKSGNVAMRPAAGSVYQQVEACAAEIRKHDSKLTPEQARAAVWKQHPELYDAYQLERRAR